MNKHSAPTITISISVRGMRPHVAAAYLGTTPFRIDSLIVLALAMEGLSRTVQAGQAPNQSWLLLAGLVPALSFIVGGALFLVNLVWAIVLKVKTS